MNARLAARPSAEMPPAGRMHWGAMSAGYCGAGAQEKKREQGDVSGSMHYTSATDRRKEARRGDAH